MSSGTITDGCPLNGFVICVRRQESNLAEGGIVHLKEEIWGYKNMKANHSWWMQGKEQDLNVNQGDKEWSQHWWPCTTREACPPSHGVTTFERSPAVGPISQSKWVTSRWWGWEEGGVEVCIFASRALGDKSSSIEPLSNSAQRAEEGRKIWKRLGKKGPENFDVKESKNESKTQQGIKRRKHLQRS